MLTNFSSLSTIFKCSGYTPLLHAIARWYPDALVDKLLELGADMTAIHNGEGDNAFGLVAKHGLLKIAMLLMNHSIDMDYELKEKAINHINDKHEGFVSL